MMIPNDTLLIMFSCVAANHLGLVSAVERVIGMKIPVVNCVKCLTFWSVAAYLIYNTHDVILSVSVSFLMSLVALWVELGMGYIDTLYMRIYENIFTENDGFGTDSADVGEDDSEV